MTLGCGIEVTSQAADINLRFVQTKNQHAGKQVVTYSLNQSRTWANDGSLKIKLQLKNKK